MHVSFCADEHEHRYYFVELEYLMCIRIEIVNDCEDVQTLIPNSQDGEYCLSIDSSKTPGTRIYCHGLATLNFTSYLSLPAGSDESFSFTSQK